MLRFLRENNDILMAGLAIILGLALVFIGVVAWAGIAPALIVIGSIIIGLTIISVGLS